MAGQPLTIADNIARIRQQLQQAASDAQRDPANITLVAVSKTKPVAMIKQAIACGQLDFGENYVQEGIEKVQQLSTEDNLCWHFIGPIQSNKTKDIAQHFQWVHSIDRFKIARRLSEQRPATLPPLQVLIQVNIDDETSKAGVNPDQVIALAAQITALPQINLRGLMAIPAAKDAGDVAPSFERMHGLFLQLQAQYKEVDTLSMGMSNDLSEAIAAGATMIRVGSAIFGARD